LRTVLMAVHKHCYTSLKLTQQGGPGRRETLEAVLRRPIRTAQSACSLDRTLSPVKAWWKRECSAMAPARSDENNLDQVPELLPAGTSERLLRAAPRREVELRITSALYNALYKKAPSAKKTRLLTRAGRWGAGPPVPCPKCGKRMTLAPWAPRGPHRSSARPKWICNPAAIWKFPGSLRKKVVAFPPTNCVVQLCSEESPWNRFASHGSQ
jgi:hypothetical protein